MLLSTGILTVYLTRMPRRALIQLHIVNRNNVMRNNNNDIRYPLIHMRDHLFHAAFVRLAIIYARIFSPRKRKIIEILILTMVNISIYIFNLYYYYIKKKYVFKIQVSFYFLLLKQTLLFEM